MPRPNQGTRLLRLIGIIEACEQTKMPLAPNRAELLEALSTQLYHAGKDLTDLDWSRIRGYAHEAITEAKALIAEWAKRDAEAKHPLSAGH